MNRPRSRRRRALRVLRWCLRLFLLVVLAMALVTAWVFLTLPDVRPLRDGPPARTAFIDDYLERCARSGRPADLRWRWVERRAISPHLARAVIAAEDLSFFWHDGFDHHEIEIALREAWEERRFPRGASTLTQQLARNLYLSPSKTPWRKAQEALITMRLERELDKQRILTIYLNVVEFGPGIYGAEAASRAYFGIGAAQLDPLQAAQLAAVLPRPSTWSPARPTRGYQAAVRRIQRRVEQAEFLQRMVRDHASD